MNKKISVSVALTITLIAITVTFAITWLISSESFNKAVSSVTQRQAQYSKLAEVDNYVRHNYYGEIDDTLLNDRIAQGYLNGIDDRFSTYYSEKEYTEYLEFERGERVDVGLELVREADGYFRIVRVYPDSPAFTAGILEGGRITFVDDTDSKTVTSVRRLQNLLRGPVGETVKVTCLYGTTDEQVFEVKRTSYTLPTVEYVHSGDFGYFRIYSFDNNTFTDFDYLLNQALADEVEGLLFDLRGNPGGPYAQAYSMIDVLCPRGTVAKSQAKNGTTKVLATSDESAVDLPMVVLVNENTAAAAELFALSIRDLSGGQIAGTTTLGKGSIQSTPQQLTDGSAVSITTAMLLTGRDESFDTTGIVPDVEVLMAVEDEGLLYKAVPKGDQQVQRALELLRGMTGDTSLEILTEDEEVVAEVVPPSQSGLGEDESASGPDGDDSASLTEGDAADAGADGSAAGEVEADEDYVPGEDDSGSSISSGSGSGASSSSSSRSGNG